ncbi:MAG: MFS transporter [Burkholderiales bacterium]|nr:MAG: MFS transporter [Burkholderiales bacterium]
MDPNEPHTADPQSADPRAKPPHATDAGRSGRRLPPSVWALGLTSLFMDVSSELVHALLPLYLATVLGASMLAIGIIEGIAEATAQLTKPVSGWLSDRLRRRKPLAVAGYGLAAIVKPVFPLATSVGWVFAARFVDRIGKGIRGAPRDALIADLVPAGQRGAAYGLRQSLDSVGAFVGPLAAIGLMVAMADDIRAALWFAVAPALVALAVLVFGVREPAPRVESSAPRAPVGLAELRALPGRLWLVVGLGAVLTLARFSEAFLILRAVDVGLALAWAPAVMVVMNLVYAALSYPAGLVADRIGTRMLLLAGVAALVGADLVLAWLPTVAGAFAGTALWGMHMALTQGLLAKLVADAAPERLRGSAFGLFNLATGVALLAASVVAGALWQAVGPSATFVAGAAFAAVAGLGMLLGPLRPRHGEPSIR